jgi:hypothetical protein
MSALFGNGGIRFAKIPPTSNFQLPSQGGARLQDKIPCFVLVSYIQVIKSREVLCF